jgi:pantothenate kinase
MGLDMYAMVTSTQPAKPVDFEDDDAELIHQWRKHPNLHGWMENLYREKGGTETFNCRPVLLTLEDIDRLEADIRSAALPETTGFFFGHTDGSERDDDLVFIAKARAAIAEGIAVFYDSWW